MNIHSSASNVFSISSNLNNVTLNNKVVIGIDHNKRYGKYCSVIMRGLSLNKKFPPKALSHASLNFGLNAKMYKTIITITHDLELAQNSDKIFVFKNGTITASGTPSEIFMMEDILNDSNLEVPFKLQLYRSAKNDEVLSKDRKLIDSLWQLGLIK